MTALGRAIALAMLTLTLAAGCGGGPEYSDAFDAANTLGCEGIQEVQAADRQYFVDQALECSYANEDATVEWFNSSDGVKRYRQAAEAVTGGSLPTDPLLYGRNWVLVCASKGQCAKAAKELGGEVSS